MTYICDINPLSFCALGACDNPLGMESFEIPDASITASSSYDQSVSAPNARSVTSPCLYVLYGKSFMFSCLSVI